MKAPPPIGAAVRHEGRLGERIKTPRHFRKRGWRGFVAVRFDDDTVWYFPVRELSYVARNLETALAWEKRKEEIERQIERLNFELYAGYVPERLR